MSARIVSRETKELIEIAVKAAFEKAQLAIDTAIAAALANARVQQLSPRLLTVSKAMAY